MCLIFPSGLAKYGGLRNEHFKLKIFQSQQMLEYNAARNNTRDWNKKCYDGDFIANMYLFYLISELNFFCNDVDTKKIMNNVIIKCLERIYDRIIDDTLLQNIYKSDEFKSYPFKLNENLFNCLKMCNK
jgi:hypothetical protein